MALMDLCALRPATTVQKGTKGKRCVMTNFQRLGSISDAHVGREFENIALEVLAQNGFSLKLNYSVDVGVGGRKKAQGFDRALKIPQ